MTSDARFAGTRVSVYDAPGHSFPRLTLRYKANLVQLAGGTRHLDLSTPEARAHALSPTEWREKLQDRAAGKGPPFLLDVRNGYEWDTGRFEARAAGRACFAFGSVFCSDTSGRCSPQGAERPVTESFRETVEAYSAPGGCVIARRDAPRRPRLTPPLLRRPLADAPRDAEIMMYCTGGATFVCLLLQARCGAG